MDTALFCTLLRNLLHLNVTLLSDPEADLAAYEEKYCYDPRLQAVHTKDGLLPVVRAMEERCIYGVRDELGVCAYLFSVDGERFLLGPSVKTDFDEEKIERILIEQHIPAAYLSSLRLYYSAFPTLSTDQVRSTVMACVRSFGHMGEDYRYIRLRGDTDALPMLSLSHEEALDYSAVYARYDLENRFLRTIETGDTEHVLITYDRMSAQGLSQKRYVNAVYQDPGVSLSMVRALARKAAERGGASVVQINEITQRTVQKILSSPGMNDQNRLTRAMLVELSEAVRQHRLRAGNYSLPIQNTLEFLALNYSQELRLHDLASRAALSEAYLSKSFKKEVGMSITQYIANLRCTQAAQMLRDSSYPISEISSYVGYIDNNYFVKVFKKQYGMTPTEYRSSKIRCEPG
ncbi:MAG: helix-turn-helix transcriptional regulator [Lachnospiraceae bacterium]|nr:helix-turn-helix transcriptional regulator [Lachnospiraceae bacterium]